MPEVTEQKPIKDLEGNALEVGATYCCVTEDFEGERTCGELFVYAGTEQVEYTDGRIVGRHIFLDYDLDEEIYPDWDFLVRQLCPLLQLEAA